MPGKLLALRLPMPPGKFRGIEDVCDGKRRKLLRFSGFLMHVHRHFAGISLKAEVRSDREAVFVLALLDSTNPRAFIATGAARDSRACIKLPS